MPERITRPEFAICVRGCERAQVDAYFGRVVEWLAEADGRVVAAERSRESLAREVSDLRATISVLEQRAGLPAPQSISGFSERLSQVMESAIRAAQELRMEAERDAHERRESAAGGVERVVAGAREEAEGIVEGARRAERAMEEGIGELRAARADAVETLVDLQRRIASAIGVAEPVDDGDMDDGNVKNDVDVGEPTIIQPAVGGGASRSTATARRRHSA